MKAKKILIFAVILILTASCAPRRRHHHFRCSDEELNETEKHKTTTYIANALDYQFV